MKFYCTYFDSNYLTRGLALHQSLVEQHHGPFILWALCFDDHSYRLLSKLNNPTIRPISLNDLERGDLALQAAKQNRSKVEYYFTCSPSWLLWLLNQHPEIDLLSYLDADLYFFADPGPIFDEFGKNSILIIGHRFPERLRHREIFGIYNVGFLTFRTDVHGRSCLERWRAQCLEWCFDRPENGKFADQKYLDDWPSTFEAVTVLQNKGANLAPWNWMNYSVADRNGTLTVDDQQLIFFHYHGLKVLNRWLYDSGTGSYQPLPRRLRKRLYDPYLQAIRKAEVQVQAIDPSFSPAYSGLFSRGYGRRALIRGLMQQQIGINRIASSVKSVGEFRLG